MRARTKNRKDYQRSMEYKVAKANYFEIFNDLKKYDVLERELLAKKEVYVYHHHLKEVVMFEQGEVLRNSHNEGTFQQLEWEVKCDL